MLGRNERVARRTCGGEDVPELAERRNGAAIINCDVGALGGGEGMPNRRVLEPVEHGADNEITGVSGAGIVAGPNKRSANGKGVRRDPGAQIVHLRARGQCKKAGKDKQDVVAHG